MAMTDRSKTNLSPPGPFRQPAPLVKARSWCPDASREEAWLRRKGIHQDRRRDGRLTRSVTDEDLEELRGCIDLGFGFDFASPSSDSSEASRLSDTFPALDLYYAVKRQYSEAMAGDASPPSSGSAPSSDESSPICVYSPGESPEQVKARLKQWAQVVACAVRQQHSC